MIEQGPANGPAGAAVNVVEFSDFECPFCRRLNATLEQLNKQHPSQIRWIFLDYPLVNIHPWARAAAIAGVCVAEQSPEKFWVFEPMLYEHQAEIKPETASEQLHGYALAAGAAPDQYDACIHSPEAANRVSTSIAQGKSLGVSGTPTLFVNGRKVVGGVSLDSLEAAVMNELELAQRNTLSGGQYQSKKK
jgi:protein-disulfide isomerase